MLGDDLIQHVPDMLCVADLKGYFTAVNPAFSEVLGYSEAELLSRPFIDFVHPEDCVRTLAEFERLKNGIDTIRFVNRYRCRNGQWKWLAWSTRAPARGETVMYALARDITQERLEYESIRADQELRRLLLREINHRTRNNFSTLLALVKMSCTNYANVDDVCQAMQTRIKAMVSIHELLSRATYVAVPFERLFGELAANIRAEQVRLSGPSIDVPARQINAMGMVLNELIVNSQKHGALRSPFGRVELTWTAHPSDSTGTDVVMTWRETGGPACDPSASGHGLGMQLVQGLVRSELGGTITASFPATGATHQIHMRLDGPPQASQTAKSCA